MKSAVVFERTSLEPRSCWSHPCFSESRPSFLADSVCLCVCVCAGRHLHVWVLCAYLCIYAKENWQKHLKRQAVVVLENYSHHSPLDSAVSEFNWIGSKQIIPCMCTNPQFKIFSFGEKLLILSVCIFVQMNPNDMCLFQTWASCVNVKCVWERELCASGRAMTHAPHCVCRAAQHPTQWPLLSLLKPSDESDDAVCPSHTLLQMFESNSWWLYEHLSGTMLDQEHVELKHVPVHQILTVANSSCVLFNLKQSPTITCKL